MIDTLRTDFPADMTRAVDFPQMGMIENMANDMVDRVKGYAHDHPLAFGMWAFGIGFVLGWKLKPW